MNALVTRIQCPHCGAENYASDSMCMDCGKSLQAGPSPGGRRQSTAGRSSTAPPGSRLGAPVNTSAVRRPPAEAELTIHDCSVGGVIGAALGAIGLALLHSVMLQEKGLSTDQALGAGILLSLVSSVLYLWAFYEPSDDGAGEFSFDWRVIVAVVAAGFVGFILIVGGVYAGAGIQLSFARKGRRR